MGDDKTDAENLRASMRRSRRSSMAFQAALHGFPDMNELTDSSPTAAAAVVVAAAAVGPERRRSSTTSRDSSVVMPELKEEEETSVTQLASDKKDGKVEDGEEGTAPAETSGDGDAGNCEKSASRGSAIKKDNLARRSRLRKSVESSGNELEMGEERRTSLMALFRNPRARRRRSSMFQNMVNWVRIDTPKHTQERSRRHTPMHICHNCETHALW